MINDNNINTQLHNKLEIKGRILKLLSYPVFLTHCETIILTKLIDNYGEYLSAEEISKAIDNGTCSARSVVTHIYSINQKATQIISRQLILCKRGKGYILNNKI